MFRSKHRVSVIFTADGSYYGKLLSTHHNPVLSSIILITAWSLFFYTLRVGFSTVVSARDLWHILISWLHSLYMWSATSWSLINTSIYSCAIFLLLSQCSHLNLMATSNHCWMVRWSSMDYLLCVLQSILPTLLPVLLKSYSKCTAVRWVWTWGYASWTTGKYCFLVKSVSELCS